MSYNPISFNVIRQALRWSNLPPCVISGTGVTAKLPNGTTLAGVTIEFSGYLIDSWLDEYGDDSHDLFLFRRAVQDSFCEDIEVASWTADVFRETMTAHLITRLALSAAGTISDE